MNVDRESSCARPKPSPRQFQKRRRERGSSLVELAFVLPMFLLLLVAVIEFSLMFWVNLTMQNAVREGARYAVTGQKASGQQSYQTVIDTIRTQSMGLFDRVSPSIKVNNGNAYATAESYNAGMFGAPGDTIVLEITCYWHLITPLMLPFFDNGTYQFTVATTMRNEYYK